MNVRVLTKEGESMKYDEVFELNVREGYLFILDAVGATLAAFAPGEWRYAYDKDSKSL